MSRGVKDLRELVVVSRLTFRESDSENDDERAGMITPFESIKISQKTYSRRTSKEGTSDGRTPTPPSSAEGKRKRIKRKRRKPQGYVSVLQANFPLSKPLPAVGHIRSQHTYSNNSHGSVTESYTELSAVARTDYSNILQYMEEEVVADWLQKANSSLKELNEWCTDKNFVDFAQFWITDFGVEKRCEILALEHSILLDEMTLAFSPALSKGDVKQSDLVDFLSALFREYPRKLTMSAGVYLFLDYLDIFTSERASEYRTILADVKLSTRNKEHVQWVLATRCFILMNVWVAITNFYRNICGNSTTQSNTAANMRREKKVVHYQRLVEAIRLGHTEAVHYFLYSGKVSAGYVDEHKKTLLHIATAANKPRTVEYLLKKWTGCLDVNRPCDTGNSPLHVAVNLGSAPIVQLLLQVLDINVNLVNEQCDGAMPIHLAVFHGHTDIVEMLIRRGANTNTNIGDLSLKEVAEDFGHKEIVLLLERNCSYSD